MQGFDPKYASFPDYLLKVVQDIWEEQDLGTGLETHCHPAALFRMPGGIGDGPGDAMQEILSTRAAFPDLKLFGEDVIWSGRPEVGMLGSIRMLASGSHRGDGVFGRPTQRHLSCRAIGDCYAKDGRIVEAWLIRDTGDLLRQLGLDPAEWVRSQMVKDDAPSQVFRPELDVAGPYTGQGNDVEWGIGYADILQRIMAGQLSVIAEQYDRACHLVYPGGTLVNGTSQAEAFWLGLRAAFPSAQFQIHHRIGMEEPLMPPRAAVRWSLSGCHDGWGAFGKPSGADVHIMGMTHAEFGPWGLRREWTMFDEAAIWAQIIPVRG